MQLSIWNATERMASAIKEGINVLRLILSFTFVVTACFGESSGRQIDKVTWKQLRSKQGYKVDYPKNWKLIVGPEGKVNSKIDDSSHILIPNIDAKYNEQDTSFAGIEIFGFDLGSQSRVELERKRILSKKSDSDPPIFLKEEKILNGTSIILVELSLTKKATFTKYIFCGQKKFWIMTQSSEPVPSQIAEKIIAGHFALPSQAEKVFESFSCDR